MSQRLVRAKRTLRTERVSIPPPEAYAARLSSVLDVLYLMFAEGHACHDTVEVVRHDIVDESLRLITMLTSHELGDRPVAHALGAVLFFQASRMRARIGGRGELLPLHLQDRARWDNERIARGLWHLTRAPAGALLTEYHLLAGIAACHATAPHASQTDWPKIALLYDALVARNDSWPNALGRAIAHGRAHGPAQGLLQLAAIEAPPAPLAAARADCLRRLGRFEEAQDAYATAATHASSTPERLFFEQRAQNLAS